MSSTAPLSGTSAVVSTWREWNDEAGNGHFHVTLTPADQRAMPPVKYQALLNAREQIKWAFTPEDEA